MASSPENTMEMVFVLKAVPLFSGLSAQQLVPVADILTEVTYEEDDIVFQQGTEGLALYVVVDGEVEVVSDGEVLATLGRNECFGEMAVLDRALRSATIRVTRDVVLFRIARDDFQDLLELYPTLAKGVIRVLVGRVRASVA